MSKITYQYRLYPNKKQETDLFYILRVARHWYNMCIEDRKLAWELEGRSVTKSHQQANIKFYKRTFLGDKPVHTHVLQIVILDVDKAYQAFFRRVKSGEKAGYPRFKSAKRFRSFGFAEHGNGFKVDGRRLRLTFVGRIRVRWHRPIEGKIKTCRISYKAGKWYVSFNCEVPDSEPLPLTGNSIGLDVGLSHLLTTSEGNKVDNPKWYREAQSKLRILQRKLQRAKRGSNNRKKVLRQVQRHHEHIKNQRKDFIDKLVFGLIQDYDLIAIEDLQINNMVKNKRLSKSILDAGWGYFKERLNAKAVEAGRLIVEVNPAYTSKSCSNCGAIFEDLKLSDRWVTCECGLSLDRDHNAAINILQRAGRAHVA